MIYTVEMTASAFQAIRTQARFIAIECQAPVSAKRWVERVWDVVDSLERYPRRGALAAEDAFVPYEVRQLYCGSHRLLFTIDDQSRKVRVLSLRHERQHAHSGDLPEDPRAGGVPTDEGR